MENEGTDFAGSARRLRHRSGSIPEYLRGRPPEFDQYLALHETCVHLLELKSEGLIREMRSGMKKRYLPQ
jgi:hypothetical protein